MSNNMHFAQLNQILALCCKTANGLNSQQSQDKIESDFLYAPFRINKEIVAASNDFITAYCYNSDSILHDNLRMVPDEKLYYFRDIVDLPRSTAKVLPIWAIKEALRTDYTEINSKNPLEDVLFLKIHQHYFRASHVRYLLIISDILGLPAASCFSLVSSCDFNWPYVFRLDDYDLYFAISKASINPNKMASIKWKELLLVSPYYLPPDKNKFPKSVQEDNPFEFIITDIKQGDIAFQDKFLYAKVERIGHGLVCSATADFILRMFYGRRDKVQNYQQVLEMFLDFYNEGVRKDQTTYIRHFLIE